MFSYIADIISTLLSRLFWQNNLTGRAQLLDRIIDFLAFTDDKKLKPAEIFFYYLAIYHLKVNKT
jgi:hypothetical protein